MLKLNDLLVFMYDDGEGSGGGGEGSSGQQEGSGQGGDQKPPWGDDFDAEKAWRTIQQQRESERTLKAERDTLRGKVQEHEQANETAAEKAAREKAAAEERATKAEGSALRLEVALDKAPEGMSLGQVRKLAKRLAGSNKEELEQDAEELFADFAPAEPGKAGGTSRRPTERLRPGAAPASEPEENDPRKLAEKVGEQY